MTKGGKIQLNRFWVVGCGLCSLDYQYQVTVPQIKTADTLQDDGYIALRFRCQINFAKNPCVFLYKIEVSKKVSGCVGASRRKVANERVVRGKT